MNSNEQRVFLQERIQNVSRQGEDSELRQLAVDLLKRAAQYKYGFNSDWLGRPIIQLPEDLLAMQEIIWQIKPDLVIETGIALGGSIIFYASMLELNASCGGPERAKAVGIDIDIRPHNRQEIEKHPLFKRIDMIEGSSVDPEIVEQVRDIAKRANRVMVCLDSNHTHNHVLAELEAYAPLVGIGSYCVVFDTLIEDMPDEMFHDRPWGKGNNPKTAVWEYLKHHDNFEIDSSIQHKLLLTVCPDGYLKRVK